MTKKLGQLVSVEGEQTATKKRRPGRKTILTEEMTAQFNSAVSQGMPERYASELIGVPMSDVSNWTAWGIAARGKKPSKRTPNDALYLAFLEQLEKARSIARLKRVQVIEKAAEGGAWQAAAWWLERMCPESFGRPYAVAVPGKATNQDGNTGVVNIIIDVAVIPAGKPDES